jgi:valyl-tRNA synthetase
MPFVTEEVFQAIKSHTALALDETIMTSRWPERKNFGDVPREDSAVNRIIEVIENIRNIKAELGIPQKKIPLEVSINKINRNADEEIWRKHQNWIKRLAWIDRIEFRDTLSRVIYRTPQWEFNLVSDEVDTQGFKAALDKKIGQAQPVLNKTLAKLNNEGFVKNADPEVVESEKEKSAQLSGQLKRLTELREAFK